MASDSTFPGFHSPAAGPEHPLDMLSACHERVQRQCDTLLRLWTYLQSHVVDPTAADAAMAILNYFEKSAPHHHADEEQDLLPALERKLMAQERTALQSLSQELMRQHRVLESRWSTLQASLRAIANQQPVTLVQEEVDTFVSGYRAHIDLEEGQLLPWAKRVLDETDLQTLGLSMSQRRGLRL